MTETTDRTESSALAPEVEHALGTLWSAMRHELREPHADISEDQVYSEIDAEFDAMHEEYRPRIGERPWL
jgi:hypothetical protein